MENVELNALLKEIQDLKDQLKAQGLSAGSYGVSASAAKGERKVFRQFSVEIAKVIDKHAYGAKAYGMTAGSDLTEGSIKSQLKQQFLEELEDYFGDDQQ